MIRGAQSGGVVAYDFNNISKQTNGEDKAYHPRKVSSKAIRSRLVNKKRTDLSQLLRVKVQRDLRRAMLFDSDRFIPRIFAGHTRFATSSIATLDGSHPHRWTPPSKRRVLYGKSKRQDENSTTYSCNSRELYNSQRRF